MVWYGMVRYGVVWCGAMSVLSLVVPKSTANCLDSSTSPELCIHTLRSNFTGRDMIQSPAGSHNTCMVTNDPKACMDVDLIETKYGGYFKLAYAAFHCHAPAWSIA